MSSHLLFRKRKDLVACSVVVVASCCGVVDHTLEWHKDTMSVHGPVPPRMVRICASDGPRFVRRVSSSRLRTAPAWLAHGRRSKQQIAPFKKPPEHPPAFGTKAPDRWDGSRCRSLPRYVNAGCSRVPSLLLRKAWSGARSLLSKHSLYFRLAGILVTSTETVHLSRRLISSRWFAAHRIYGNDFKDVVV
jgi:hypothetical protein